MVASQKMLMQFIQRQAAVRNSLHYNKIMVKICNAANYILSLAVHFRQLRWIVFMLIGNCILEFTWTEPSHQPNESNPDIKLTQDHSKKMWKWPKTHSYFDIRVHFILQDLYLRSDRTHYKKENVLCDFSAEVSPNEHAVLNVAVSLRQTDESASNKHTSIRPYCTSLLISAYVICACNLKFREDGYSRLSSSKQCLSRKAMRLLRLWREWPQSYLWRHNGKNSALWLFFFFFFWLAAIWNSGVVMWMHIY